MTWLCCTVVNGLIWLSVVYMFPTQSLTITPQNGSTLHSARARVYGPRAPYSTHLDLTPSPIPAGQASTSSIGRSHSNSPLNVSDIDGSSPSYLRRLSRPTRDILKVADIPGTTSQHSKFRSQRSYNNPVDPVSTGATAREFHTEAESWRCRRKRAAPLSAFDVPRTQLTQDG